MYSSEKCKICNENDCVATTGRIKSSKNGVFVISYVYPVRTSEMLKNTVEIQVLAVIVEADSQGRYAYCTQCLRGRASVS